MGKGHFEVFDCVHYGQFFSKENDGRDRDLNDSFRKRRTLSYLGW